MSIDIRSAQRQKHTSWGVRAFVAPRSVSKMPYAALTSVLGKSGPPFCWLRILFAIYLGSLSFDAGAQTPAEELRTAAAVRGLTVEEAQQHRRVRLRGGVTFFEENLFSRFIQDETAGVYLSDPSPPLHLSPGQLVEVESTTSPGGYTPI